MEETIIEANNIVKSFIVGNERSDILKDISLSIKKGEFTSIMGPSGSGKSTLLYILGNLDFEYYGEGRFMGKNLFCLSR